MQFSFTAEDLQIETLDTISEVIGAHETRELLQSLVDSLDMTFADMRVARAASNFNALARAAHRLAGGCGSLGAKPMQDALRELEKAALKSAVGRCDAELGRLPMLADKLRSAVETYSLAEAALG